MITTLIKIAFIVVIVWDVLQFPNEIANGIAYWLTRGKIRTVVLRKPLGCSLCMTFWCSIFYVLICIGFVSITTFIGNLSLCLMVAYSTTYIQMTINLINKLIINLFVRLEKLIDKI